ncbi:hypothetical protein [Succinimonas amylolytica]|uniref:hypothetical protein n=1 Tax=Succinimonas amylolytica TaxID=83769 RepID=UPI000369A83F|nr:hypothetical protein [Succinimonas amylolytica]
MNQINTGLSEHIIKYGARPDYDEAAKRLLSHKIVIANILKLCIPEFRDSGLTTEEIIGDYLSGNVTFDSSVPVGQEAPDADSRIQCLNSEDRTITEGTISFDILFDVRVPGSKDSKSFITVDIEFQGKQTIGYPLMNRAEYYLGRLISRQKGIVFNKTDYQKLRKVYSLWINMGRNRHNWCAEYPRRTEVVLGNMAENDECNFSDRSMAIVINVDQNDENNPAPVFKFLGALFFRGKNVAERQKVLQNEFGIPMTENIYEEVYNMCNLSEGIFEEGLEKGLEKGEKIGLEKGKKIWLEKGEKNGFVKGEKNATLNLIRNLIETMKVTAQQAFEMLKIPESDRGEYLKELQKI